MSRYNLIYNPNEISVYIHWPYCLKKCPYCDFNSYVTKEINFKEWEKAYLNDLEKQSIFLKNKNIKTIFFGGGTPSLMDPHLVHNIISFITKINKNVKPVEITLEVNPSTFEISKFKLFKEAMINRVSIGIQSFNDDQLKFLGRVHSAKESISAIEEANKIFDNTSFDLINGLKNQSTEDWNLELQKAIPLIKNHISIYELTIEEGTVFYKQKKQAVNEDIGREMFLLTSEVLAKNNILPYEISNYCRNDRKSLHNLNYWRGGLYLGVGPGAHGRILKNEKLVAISNYKNPNKWLELAKAKKCTFQEQIILNNKERIIELLISNLRIFEPISKMLLSYINKNDIDFLIKQGLLKKTYNGIETTIEGKLKLNSIISYLFDSLI